MKNARELVTPWHEGWGIVSDKTKVYVIPASIQKLVHKCPSSDVQITLVMYKPTHNTHHACYCADCDTLFVGDDAVIKEKDHG